jgi:hypothetical protein
MSVGLDAVNVRGVHHGLVPNEIFGEYYGWDYGTVTFDRESIAQQLDNWGHRKNKLRLGTTEPRQLTIAPRHHPVSREPALERFRVVRLPVPHGPQHPRNRLGGVGGSSSGADSPNQPRSHLHDTRSAQPLHRITT